MTSPREVLLRIKESAHYAASDDGKAWVAFDKKEIVRGSREPEQVSLILETLEALGIVISDQQKQRYYLTDDARSYLRDCVFGLDPNERDACRLWRWPFSHPWLLNAHNPAQGTKRYHGSARPLKVEADIFQQQRQLDHLTGHLASPPLTLADQILGIANK